MKRRFFLAFVALFALFAVGIGVSLRFLSRGSSELREVLGLHQVEDLRQSLSRSLRTSQRELQVSGTVFADTAEVMAAHSQELGAAVQGCFACHHRPELHRELERVAELVGTYERQLGAFLAAPADAQSRKPLQLEAAATADQAEAIIEGMLRAAGPALERRTEEATAQVERSWITLMATLIVTFALAIYISLALTRSVTDPLDRLVAAAERLEKGDLEYRIEHRERNEFGTLMDAFNSMGAALQSKTDQLGDHVKKLFRLNQSVVTLCAQTSHEELFAHEVEAIDDLLDVDLRGNIVPSGMEGVFLVSLARRGRTAPEYRNAVSLAKLEKLRASQEPAMLVVQEDEVRGWPFGAWAPADELRNYLFGWIQCQGELRGGLVAVNRTSGGFTAEECGLMAALSQAAGPAVDQARGVKDLRAEVELLRARDEPELPG